MEAQLQRAGWKAAAVHGDASQAQRTRAVEQFKVRRLRRGRSRWLHMTLA